MWHKVRCTILILLLASLKQHQMQSEDDWLKPRSGHNFCMVKGHIVWVMCRPISSSPYGPCSLPCQLFFWSELRKGTHKTQLRARRALLQLKDVPSRTRRALLLYKVSGNSALLVLNGTSLICNSVLLALNWWKVMLPSSFYWTHVLLFHVYNTNALKRRMSYWKMLFRTIKLKFLHLYGI